MNEKLIQKSREYAYQKHSAMTISDGKPYSVHLDNVVANVKRFIKHPSAELLMAAYLHDTVEDTDATLEEIEHMFGTVVKDLVWRVTDEPGANRKERKSKTYPKISGHLGATIVKLCDRIANVEYPSSNKQKYLSMYRKEQAGFEAICKIPTPDPKWNEVQAMWDHLTKALK
jgi:(p)ppGpp synthase/HD superfamily hydrolase